MTYPLEILLAGVIVISVILYALLGGADFGGGVWDLLAFGPRARQQREVISRAIAPIWEANHVWLILTLTVLFTVFPAAFAAMMTALHIPLTVVLVGIVFRGSAFVFRRYGSPTELTYRRWSIVFGIASLVTPFFLGISLGAIASGSIRIKDALVSTGFLAGWTSPFALACGVFALGLFTFLAATYLTLDAYGELELQDDFRARALLSGLLLAPMAAIVFILARDSAPYIFMGLTSPWSPLLLAFTSLCAIATLAALWYRRFNLARVAAIGQVSAILLGWGFAQYPYLIVPDLTIHESAGPAATLELVTLGLLVGFVILVPSLLYLLYIFKGRRAPLVQGSDPQNTKEQHTTE